MTDFATLSRRERQIMEALYALGSATAAQVREALDDAPSYSTVRTFLGLLEQKGHIEHTQQGKAYVYTPVVAPPTAARRAMGRVVETFFRGSAADAISALLTRPDAHISTDELDRIEALIAEARQQEDTDR